MISLFLIIFNKDDYFVRKKTIYICLSHTAIVCVISVFVYAYENYSLSRIEHQISYFEHFILVKKYKSFHRVFDKYLSFYYLYQGVVVFMTICPFIRLSLSHFLGWYGDPWGFHAIKNVLLSLVILQINFKYITYLMNRNSYIF